MGKYLWAPTMEMCIVLEPLFNLRKGEKQKVLLFEKL